VSNAAEVEAGSPVAFRTFDSFTSGAAARHNARVSGVGHFHTQDLALMPLERGLAQSHAPIPHLLCDSRHDTRHMTHAPPHTTRHDTTHDVVSSVMILTHTQREATGAHFDGLVGGAGEDAVRMALRGVEDAERVDRAQVARHCHHAGARAHVPQLQRSIYATHTTHTTHTRHTHTTHTVSLLRV
jgi:hypothetical protein